VVGFGWGGFGGGGGVVWCLVGLSWGSVVSFCVGGEWGLWWGVNIRREER